MNHERLRMIEQLKEANERNLDDNAIRQARRAAGQEPAMWTLPEPEQPKPTRSPSQPTDAMIARMIAEMRAEMRAECDDRIAFAFKSDVGPAVALREAIGQALADERKSNDAKIAKVEKRISEIEKRRSIDADDGSVISLPPFVRNHAR